MLFGVPMLCAFVCVCPGQIPVSVSQLINLTELNLGGNKLSGKQQLLISHLKIIRTTAAYLILFFLA